MPTNSGMKRWGTEQHTHIISLFRAYHDDERQGITYHFDQLSSDMLRELYNLHPVFAMTDWQYFSSHVRDQAARFRANLDREGGRRRQQPSEFRFYFLQFIYLITILFLTFLFFV